MDAQCYYAPNTRKLRPRWARPVLKVPSKTSACVRSIVTFQTARPSFLIEFLFHCLWLEIHDSPWTVGAVAKQKQCFSKPTKRDLCAAFGRPMWGVTIRSCHCWHVCLSTFISVAALPLLKFQLWALPSATGGMKTSESVFQEERWWKMQLLCRCWQVPQSPGDCCCCKFDKSKQKEKFGDGCSLACLFFFLSFGRLENSVVRNFRNSIFSKLPLLGETGGCGASSRWETCGL